MIEMPGRSYDGPWVPLNDAEAALRDELRRDVEALSVEIGERNIGQAYSSLVAAREYIEGELRTSGYEPRAQEYEADGKIVANIEVEKRGARRPGNIIVLGAHYDSALGSPGGNDNATGVAAVLALARAFARDTSGATIRFVLFVNEEGPYFKTDQMGSLVYARACRAKNEEIIGMVNFDTIGCYLHEEETQRYPPPMGINRPSVGDFIALVTNISSVDFSRQIVRAFRRNVKFPSHTAVVPGGAPFVGFSDQWSFWENGYPGLLVTDTGPFRDPNYHTANDLPGGVDFDRLARVVEGFRGIVRRTLFPPILNPGRRAPVTP